MAVLCSLTFKMFPIYLQEFMDILLGLSVKSFYRIQGKINQLSAGMEEIRQFPNRNPLTFLPEL